MPISRFCELIGIPRRSYTWWRAKAVAGNPPKGPWPAPVVGVIEPVAAKYAADWPAWGHRKLHWLMQSDGVEASRSSVERALRRRGLLQPIDYQGERRELAKARKAAFAESPTRPNEVWQLDFSEYETTSGGVWRLAGVTDYFTKYEHGWHIAPTCPGTDAIEAVTIAIAEAERRPAPARGVADRPRYRTDPADQAGHRQRRHVQRGRVRPVHRLPARAAPHPHPAQVARPGTRLRQLEVRAPLPVRDRRPTGPRRRGRGLPAGLQPHSST
jgi:hypothetical protein